MTMGQISTEITVLCIALGAVAGVLLLSVLTYGLALRRKRKKRCAKEAKGGAVASASGKTDRSLSVDSGHARKKDAWRPSGPNPLAATLPTQKKTEPEQPLAQGRPSVSDVVPFAPEGSPYAPGVRGFYGTPPGFFGYGAYPSAYGMPVVIIQTAAPMQTERRLGDESPVAKEAPCGRTRNGRRDDVALDGLSEEGDPGSPARFCPSLQRPCPYYRRDRPDDGLKDVLDHPKSPFSKLRGE